MGARALVTITTPAPAKSPLVLYVDDERANRIVFEQSLGSELSVITAPDGPTALDLLDVNDVAVLVTDMRMPGMTGEELLRLAKQRHPQTTRIVVTAYSDVDPILRAINEGLVARYIIKPWQRTELIQVLRWASEAWSFARASAALHERLIETERLAMLGSMAGSLVHDLKTPLMSILVNTDTIGELASAAPILRDALERAPLGDAQKRQMIAMVEDLEPIATDLKTSAWHLNELVGKLRELGRPNTDAPSTTQVEPMPVLRHAIAVCQPILSASKGVIAYDGPDPLPLVRIAGTQLTQVLINVIANAAQAVAARGAPGGKVTVHAVERDAMLELAVRDNGIGMSPEVLAKIGTPFFTTREEGVGLGIAQCQRLIGAIGGRLHIESKLGVGTSVTISLPLV